MQNSDECGKLEPGEAFFGSTFTLQNNCYEKKTIENMVKTDAKRFPKTENCPGAFLGLSFSQKKLCEMMRDYAVRTPPQLVAIQPL